MTPTPQPSRIKTSFTVGDESYELTYGGRMLYRIVKFIGDSGMTRECNFHTLPEKVKQKIHAIVTAND